jgi:hypothetical protein
MGHVPPAGAGREYAAAPEGGTSSWEQWHCVSPTGQRPDERFGPRACLTNPCPTARCPDDASPRCRRSPANTRPTPSSALRRAAWTPLATNTICQTRPRTGVITSYRITPGRPPFRHSVAGGRRVGSRPAGSGQAGVHAWVPDGRVAWKPARRSAFARTAAGSASWAVVAWVIRRARASECGQPSSAR